MNLEYAGENVSFLLYIKRIQVYFLLMKRLV